MSPAAHPQLSSVFERALDIPLSQRDEFLDAACTGDVALRREVESLLNAHDSASDYFEKLAQRLVAPALGNREGSATEPIDLVAALEAGLANNYRIERELGGGGMSRVFLAEEIALKRRVVIKTLPPDMAATVNAERFRREIAMIAQLQHPHIVPLLTANASGLLLYYTMPFVAGESLRDRIAARGALPLDDALRIWRDVLDALAHAHASGVVHRDIKPANILLSGRHAMVADFGIARALEAAAEGTRTAGAMMTGPIGTPAYMAPEQASNTTVDHRADLYAAGLVMYEMLVGRGPFEATSARDFLVAQAVRPPAPLQRPDVPAALAQLVMQCLSKNPAGRPASAEAMLAVVEKLPDRPLFSMASMRKPRVLAVAALSLAVISFGAWRVFKGSGSGARARVQALVRHTPPDTARRLYQRGLAEHRRRTLEGATQALNLFERAIAIDSEFTLAWAATARTAQFANIRNWSLPGRDVDSLLSLAVRASDRAIALDSSSAEAWTVGGKVAGTIDLQDRAATLYKLQRALSLDSTYAEAWFELGLAEEELLHPAEAERAWLRAAALSPTNTQVLAFLGFHYLWYDNYARGVQWADSAVAVEPTFFLARDVAAFIGLAMDSLEVATRHAEATRRTRGHEPEVPLYVLATVAARRNDRALARRYLRQVEAVTARSIPSKHQAVYLASGWAAAGDTARAITWLQAYKPRGDLHFQLHVKRDPALRWVANKRW